MVSPQYELLYVGQEHLYLRRLRHKDSIDMVSLQYDSSYVGQGNFYFWWVSSNGCIDMVSLMYVTFVNILC